MSSALLPTAQLPLTPYSLRLPWIVVVRCGFGSVDCQLFWALYSFVPCSCLLLAIFCCDFALILSLFNASIIIIRVDCNCNCNVISVTNITLYIISNGKTGHFSLKHRIYNFSGRSYFCVWGVKWLAFLFFQWLYFLKPFKNVDEDRDDSFFT